MSSLLPFMILTPLVGAGFCLMCGSKLPDIVRKASLITSLLVLFFSLVLLVTYQPPSKAGGARRAIEPTLETRISWLDIELHPAGAEKPTVGSLQLYLGVDGISVWMIFLTALLVSASILISWESVTTRVASFYALLLVLEAGMIGVFCSFDLVLFYVFFEFTLIPLFFLIGMWGGPQKEYAAKRFFIYTLSGSVLTLVGMVALVACLNSRDPSRLTFSIPELAEGMQRQMLVGENTKDKLNPKADFAEQVADPVETKRFWFKAQFWIFLAMFAGFAIKVPLAPFHTWLPLAHVEAPTAGSVLLAGILLKLGSYGFLRFCLPMLPYATFGFGATLIAVLSVAGILYGSLCALAQEDVKKLVAYSSVAHLGFCMLGLAALNPEGITGSVLQMINHGLSTGALFLLVGMVYERYHTRMLSDLGGIASRLPILSCFMIFVCFSSMGLPGLNGFVGEILSLIGAFRSKPAYAIVAGIGIILGAWYLLNMLLRGFFGPEHSNAHAEHSFGDLKAREIWALAPIAILCFVIGVYPNCIMKTLQPDIEAVAKIYQDPGRLKAPPNVKTELAEATR